MTTSTARPRISRVRRHRPSSRLRWLVFFRGLLVATLLSAAMAPLATANEAQSGGPASADSVQASDSLSLALSGSYKPPTFAENTFAYIYGAKYRNPFIASASQPNGADIARHSIEFKHVDAWTYGHNFADLIIKRSNGVEPAAGGGSGAIDFYSVFRSGLSVNRVAGKSIVALGPLHDIDIQAGLDFQIKNTDRAPNARTLYFGPKFQFILGSGFLDVGLQLRKEWNHNGIVGKNEHYDLGLNIEPAWKFPFRIGRTQFVFDGYAVYNTAKGEDVSGHETRAELIVRPQLKLDVGSAIGQSPGMVELGVGFEYWHNMFGKDASKVPGAKQFTPAVSLTVYVPSARFRH